MDTTLPNRCNRLDRCASAVPSRRVGAVRGGIRGMGRAGDRTGLVGVLGFSDRARSWSASSKKGLHGYRGDSSVSWRGGGANGHLIRQVNGDRCCGRRKSPPRTPARSRCSTRGASAGRGCWTGCGTGSAVRRVAGGRRVDGGLVERVLFALVAQRAPEPGSKLAATRWVTERAAIADSSGFSDDSAYAAMDFLLKPQIAGARRGRRRGPRRPPVRTGDDGHRRDCPRRFVCPPVRSD